MIIYIVLEAMHYKIHSIFLKMAFCSSIIVSNLSADFIRFEYKLEDVFESPESMILGVNVIKKTMFNQIKEIECVYKYIKVKDIASILVQYLWLQLPNHQNIDEFQSFVESKYYQHLIN